MIYVEELIGANTVNTMPRETVEAFIDHGHAEDTLERDVEGARKTLEEFAAAGIDYDDVVEVLEREGVEKFADSFRELIDGVASKRDQLVRIAWADRCPLSCAASGTCSRSSRSHVSALLSLGARQSPARG